MAQPETNLFRIGEFSEQVGVPPELLRAWERRYGLLSPQRTPGGFRLYSDEDARRVVRMRAALARGQSAAEAALAAKVPPKPTEWRPPSLAAAGERLLEAVHAYDEAEMHAVLDTALNTYDLEMTLAELVFPLLRIVGSEWKRGRLDVSQEHFASNLIRGRLTSLARSWAHGSGPLALLACAPGETHDIGLIAFGLLVRSHGWRIMFLGTSTPVSTLARTAEIAQPAVTVVASVAERRFTRDADEFQRLAGTTSLSLGGAGATARVAEQTGGRLLPQDPVAAAQMLVESS